MVTEPRDAQRVLTVQERPDVPDHQSKERKQAEAAFAKTQDPRGSAARGEPATNTADEKIARLKAARLARDVDSTKKR